MPRVPALQGIGQPRGDCPYKNYANDLGSLYYIENEDVVWDKEQIDLNQDPPPDLVVEIDVTSSSLDRLSLYASLGVPEV